MLTFNNPVVGGVTLLTPAIQSPNFVAGVSGWQIAKAGSAEFNDITIRGGEVVGGTALYYDGPAAAGNLAFSVSGSNGTDEFGNAYLAGIWAYNSTGGGVALITVSGAAGLIIPPGGTAHANLPPQASGFAGNTGLVNEYVGLQIDSGAQTTNTGNAAINLYSETNDATAGARGSLIITGTEVIGWNSSNMTVTTGAGIKGNPDISLFDNTIDTNANNGTQPCTMQWPIPLGDAKVGTVYEIVSPFQAQNATTTVEPFGFKPSLNGAALATTGGDVIGATMLSIIGAAAKFTGEVRLTVKVQATGPTGTVDIFIKGGIGAEGNIQGGSSATSAFFSSQIIGQAFNSTVANTIAIDSTWGAGSAGQTVSNYGSVFTRKGP